MGFPSTRLVYLACHATINHFKVVLLNNYLLSLMH